MSRPTASPVTGCVTPIFRPGEILATSDDSATRDELLARARFRMDEGDTLHAMGLTGEAKHHWAKAEQYRELARQRTEQEAA